MATFTIKQGDTLPTLVATLKDASGIPVNLIGSTVTFRMANLLGEVVVEGLVTELDFSNGKVSYPWSAGETAEAGNFRAEFVVVNSEGFKETFPNTQPLTVYVSKDSV